MQAAPFDDLERGHITTIAGDGLQSRQALVARPRGVAVDAAGNIFIADTDNNRVRRIDAVTGIITTIAGFGPPTGASDENIRATVATLALPVDLAVDGGGNIFVIENSRHRVRKVDAATGLITTVAGGADLVGGFGLQPGRGRTGR